MANEITAEQVAELRALMEKATPGPWKRGGGYGWFGVELVGNDGCRRICGVAHVSRDVRDPDGRVTGQEDEPEGKANAELICAAVNALPALLSELERLQGLEARVKGAVAKWRGADNGDGFDGVDYERGRVETLLNCADELAALLALDDEGVADG